MFHAKFVHQATFVTINFTRLDWSMLVYYRKELLKILNSKIMSKCLMLQIGAKTPQQKSGNSLTESLKDNYKIMSFQTV